MSEPDVASLRARILADPGIILDDVELMRAIVQAERRGFGRQVVDLRGVLVERLEERLDRLEDTHREVLAAAYDNVAGTAQIHRACLMLLGAEDFAGFLHALTNDVQNTLHVDLVRLALEAAREILAEGGKVSMRAVARRARLTYAQVVYAFGRTENLRERLRKEDGAGRPASGGVLAYDKTP